MGVGPRAVEERPVVHVRGADQQTRRADPQHDDQRHEAHHDEDDRHDQIRDAARNERGEQEVDAEPDEQDGPGPDDDRRPEAAGEQQPIATAIMPPKMLSGAKTSTASGHGVSMTYGPPVAHEPPSRITRAEVSYSSVKQKVNSSHDTAEPSTRAAGPLIRRMRSP